MNLFASTNAQFMLFAGYVLCFIALNVIATLISVFYRRKLKQPSPRWGFLLAIAFALLFGAVLHGGMKGSEAMQAVARISLTISVIASIVSMLSLFSTMVRVRKQS